MMRRNFSIVKKKGSSKRSWHSKKLSQCIRPGSELQSTDRFGSFFGAVQILPDLLRLLNRQSAPLPSSKRIAANKRRVSVARPAARVAKQKRPPGGRRPC